jgi:hypothetical protein
MSQIKFTFGNAKLSKGTAILSIVAGKSCPAAKDCHSYVETTKTGNRIVDGKDTEFRCYAASIEALRPNVLQAHQSNFDALRNARTIEDKVALIVDAMRRQSIDTDSRRVRIHSSGDFFVQSYFDAWLQVAQMYPEIIFYAYTKSIKFWLRRINEIPANFKLTASLGGHHDDLVLKHNLKRVEVVFSREEAGNLPIDSDDTNAWQHDGNFAQLIHGTQPAGSKASAAKQALKLQGITGYGAKSKAS